MIPIFPQERVADTSDVLAELSNEQFESILNGFKFLSIRNPRRKIENLEMKIVIEMCREIPEIPTDFHKFILTPTKLSEISIIVLDKLLDLEGQSNLEYYDRGSVTLRCLDMSLKTLKLLNSQEIYCQNDQMKIKKMLLQILYKSLSNWFSIRFDRNFLFGDFHEILKQLSECNDVEICVGLLVAVFGIINNVLVKLDDFGEKRKFLDRLKHEYTEIIKYLKEIANNSTEMLYKMQKLMIKVIRNADEVSL